MPNVEVLTRFSCDEEYIAEMRYALQKQPDSVRTGYSRLVERLGELIRTERLLREEVLSGDEPSTDSRLRGVLLLYNRVGLESVKVRLPDPRPLEYDTLSHSYDGKSASGATLASSKPDLYFAVVASYRYWLRDSRLRFSREAAEEYELPFHQVLNLIDRFTEDEYSCQAVMDRLLGD